MTSRALLALLLSLLLVGAQREYVVHAVDHLRAKVAQRQGPAVTVAAPDCLECKLLASTPHAVAPASAAIPGVVVPQDVAPAPAPGRVAIARRFHDSQAPPSAA